MNKKLGVLFVVLLIFVSNVFAQIDTSGLEKSAEDFKGEAEKIKEYTEEDKWGYLGQQWKDFFLNNKYIAGVNERLSKINFIFFFLFGQDYDFSLSLFFVVLLWIFFFLNSSEAFTLFSTFNKGISYLGGFIIAVLAGHIGIYRVIVGILVKLIFIREGIWGWVWVIIFTVLLALLILFGRTIFRYLISLKDVRKRRREERRRKANAEIVRRMAEGIGEAFGR